MPRHTWRDALTIDALLKARPYFRSPSALMPERNGMSMSKHDLSSRHFQRKILEFCEVRIAPISSTRVLENIRYRRRRRSFPGIPRLPAV